MEEIEIIMHEAQAEVINIICKRLKEIGELSATDAIRIANLSRTEDLRNIRDILSTYTDKSLNEVDKAIQEASQENDELAEAYYIARGINQSTVDTSVRLGIMRQASKSIKDGILNLSKTQGFYINGKPTAITTAYTYAINKGIFAVQQGYTDYHTAIRSVVKDMAKNGIVVVDYESGYSRRLDSAVRMNLLDGIRQMNMEYREQQGKEFGADGVEISVHGLCASDHLDIQGRQYSLKDFERLQNTLERPIGELNCRHTTFPIVMGVNEPTHSKEELAEYRRLSTEQVTYTDKLGNEKSCSRYEASQLQRKQESLIRSLKDQREAFESVGDDIQAKEMQKRIKGQTFYYYKLSEEIGLSAKKNRLKY